MKSAEFKQVHCNCCRKTIETYVQEIIKVDKPSVKLKGRRPSPLTTKKDIGTIPLLYLTTSKAVICTRCADTHNFVLSGGGDPIAVYKTGIKKFSIATNFEKLYNPDTILEAYEVPVNDSESFKATGYEAKVDVIREKNPQDIIADSSEEDLTDKLYVITPSIGEEVETEVFE